MTALRIALFLLLTMVVPLGSSAAAAQDNLPWARGGRVQDSSVRIDAQALADRAGVDCEVRKVDPWGNDVYGAAQLEVTCAEGPGYLLIDRTRAEALDCLSLEASYRNSDGRTPSCRIASNRNAVPVVAAGAREAGIGCRVDAGAVRGRTPAGGIVYEVGCDGEDGYWLERAPAGWAVTACLKVEVQGGDCRFTTPAEQAASANGWLAATGASECDVVQVRFMGSGLADSGEGTDLYEARCRSGPGYVARIVSEGDGPPKQVLAVYPCAEARHIGGGCRLSDAAP